ncbi:MAG: hypothetical protein AAF514_08050 [Verrucomicrobiota bacterium]
MKRRILVPGSIFALFVSSLVLGVTYDRMAKRTETDAPTNPVPTTAPDLDPGASRAPSTASRAEKPFEPFTLSQSENLLAATRAFLTSLETVSLDEVKETLTSMSIESIEDDEMSGHVFFLLFAHFADSRLDEALPLTDQWKDWEDLPSILTAHAFGSLTRRDRDHALAQASDHDEPSLALEAYRRVLGFYHPEFDPAWANDLSMPMVYYTRLWMDRGIPIPQLLQSTLRNTALSRDDRKKIIEFLVRDFSRHSISATAIHRLLDQIPPEDSEVALIAMKKGLTQQKNPLTSLKLLYQISQSDEKVSSEFAISAALSAYPEETIAWFLTRTPEERKPMIALTFGPGISNRSPEENGLLRLLAALPPAERPEGALGRIHQPVQERPRETLDWITRFTQQLKDEGQQETPMNATLEQWAENIGGALALQDQAEAVARCQAMEPGPLRDRYVQGLINHLSQTDPSLAADLLDELPESEQNHAETVIVTGYIAREGIESGMAYLDSLDDPEARQDFVDAAVSTSRRLRPEDVATLIDTYRKEDAHPLAQTTQLIELWRRMDPEALAAWLPTYEDDLPSFEYHVGHLVEQWRFRQFDKAADFVQSLEPGPARDRGLGHILYLKSKTDPSGSLQLANTLADPEKRSAALETFTIMVDEMATHPDMAREALANLPLTDDERSHLETLLESDQLGPPTRLGF